MIWEAIMPKPVKCPKCAQAMDIEGLAAGLLVACPSCQAQLRIPGAAPSTATPRGTAAVRIPHRDPRRAGKTSTKLRAISPEKAAERVEPLASSKKRNTGLIVGIVVGIAVVLVAVIAFLATGGGKSPPPPASRAARPPTPPRPPEAGQPPTAPLPPPSPPPPTTQPSAPASEPRRASRAPRDRRTWDRIVGGLKKHATKGFDTGRWEFEHDVDPDCARAFADVKGMGPDAYPYLLAYLTNEDPMSVQAAAAALWTLLDREGRKPRRDEGAAMRAQMMPLLDVTEDDVRRAMKDLGMEP